jgi:hypothetical protein
MSANSSSSRSGTSRWRAGARFAYWAPLVGPPFYLALLLAVAPSDHFGPPDWFPDLNQGLYDDVDLAVMALRGVNAYCGRTGGRKDNPEDLNDQDFARSLWENRPLEPHYFLEYPHPSLWLFQLGFLLQPPLPPVPAAVLDACHGNFWRYRPQGDDARLLWRGFRRATTIYRLLMGACLLGLVLVFRAGYESDGRLASTGLLLLLPASLYYTFNRFDIVPALCSALSLASLGRRRPAASGFWLAVGALVKLYPAVLVPLFLRYLWPDRRALARWTLAFGATVVLFLLPHLLREGREAVEAPFRYQLTRPGDPEMNWTAYGYLLPRFLGDNDSIGRWFRAGSLLLAVALLALPRMPELPSLVRRSAIALVVFVTLPVFYSPQWIVWLFPFLLPLTRQQRGLAVLVVALDLVTFATFPGDWGGAVLWEARVYARFAVLGAIALFMLWGEVRRGASSPVAGAAGLSAPVAGAPAL